MDGDRLGVPNLPGPAWPFSWLLGSASILALILSAAVGSAWLGFDAMSTDDDVAADDTLATGVPPSIEVTDLWLPRALSPMASGRSEARDAPSAEVSKTVKNDQRSEDPWYALTVRVHRVNGVGPEITTIKHLNQPGGNFQEFLDLLAAARGETLPQPAADFSRVRVNAIPDELLESKPREAIAELISGGGPSVNQY